MVRISTRKEREKTIIQIDGVLRDDGVAELEKVVGAEKPPLVLDLSNLQNVDPPGAVVIITMNKNGVELLGASPYIQLLLDQFGPAE
jgi:hypothetical protein